MSEKQLPKWRKEVRAAKILEVKEGGELVLDGGITVHKNPKWMNHNHPDVGMYYLTDVDRLACVAQADEFEDHYTRVDEKDSCSAGDADYEPNG